MSQTKPQRAYNANQHKAQNPGSRPTSGKKDINHRQKQGNLPPLDFSRDGISTSTGQRPTNNAPPQPSIPEPPVSATPSVSIRFANLDFFNETEFPEMQSTGRPTTSRSARRPNSSHRPSSSHRSKEDDENDS